MATFYSSQGRTTKRKFAAALCFLLTSIKLVSADPTTNAVFAARAEKTFHQAQIEFQAHPDNSTNAWLLARASYELADFAKTDSIRADLANQGIAATRQLAAREPKNAAAHYYLAMNLGQLARTELLGALSLVKEMEREFKIAGSLDEKLDFAGPERNLGLLYLQAPHIGSIGDNRKARTFLQRAAKLAPDFPENRLNLIETFLQWRETDHARTEMATLNTLWPKAQANFAGEKWEVDWDDWATRRAIAQKKLDALTKTGK
ncbi:MAG TPA: hypothetical protein VGO57_04970 [Verrucomicrobiae bacterium]|jgi:hypothetical protein